MTAMVNLLHAHPHIFIDSKLTIVFDEKGLAGIKVNWFFDKMYSAILIEDYDKNSNGKLDAPEIEKMKQYAFKAIKGYNYFTFIIIDKKSYPVKKVKKFSAEKFSNRIIYEFFIPCQVKAKRSFQEIKIAMYDETYYTDISFYKKAPVRLVNDELFECSYKLRKNWKGNLKKHQRG